jgi:hypothetical protein
VDQKRLDAVALLTRMREDLKLCPQRKKINFSFACTDCWVEAQREVSSTRRQNKR